MRNTVALLREESRQATTVWGPLSRSSKVVLKTLIQNHLSVSLGDLAMIDGRWYVTHTGLLRFAKRRGCFGIRVRLLEKYCDPNSRRWTFEAIAYKSPQCRGFTGYGDADPSNVSPLVRGAEMRVAETRAVNRALRKAYGIGICSVEELASSHLRAASPVMAAPAPSPIRTNNTKGNHGACECNGIRLRDRLCQVIRKHSLDAELVKAYAIDFCGTKTLREASREQVENFVAHLADWAEKDRNALLCQLNSSRPQAGAA